MKPEPIVIKMPADSPEAKKLQKLFAQLQTSYQNPSGLLVQLREKDDLALEEVLEQLKLTLEKCGIDLGTQLKRFETEKKPDALGSVIKATLSNPLLAEGLVTPSFRRTLLNLADDIEE